MAKRRRRAADRVRHAVRRCAEACRAGDYRAALHEVAAAMPAAQHPKLEAELLVWRAQAHLGLGRPAAAAEAARRAWELHATPHTCFLFATALSELGALEDAENLLRLGVELYRETPHLPVRLAVLLAEQGRVPEALDQLEAVPPSEIDDEDLAVFVYGLRANLLAMTGRWAEASATLRAGLDRFPTAPMLRDTDSALRSAWHREQALGSLVRSWEAELAPAEGPEGDVDEAVQRLCAALEAPDVLCLAARRLWRALHRATGVRPTAVEAWAVAAVVAVTELDEEPAAPTVLARIAGVSLSTVRRALRRFRSYLDTLEPELARRNFAAWSNPRLDEDPEHPRARDRSVTVLRFTRSKGD